jgi:hypothetical protein
MFKYSKCKYNEGSYIYTLDELEYYFINSLLNLDFYIDLDNIIKSSIK